MESVKVFNIFNAPKGKKSPAGKEIYEWEYLDENGKLQKDSKNVKEEINSFVSRVDYKAQIERGELETNGTLQSGDKDFTRIPDDTIDIYKYLAYISSLSKEQAANIVEQASKANQDSVQNQQTTNQGTADAGQTATKTVQEQSANSETIGNNDAGGTK